MNKRLIQIAAIFGALSVAIGAFAAHGLKSTVTADAFNIFEVGVRYQFFHVFAIAIVGLVYAQARPKLIRLAGIFFILGIILFSGSLYALTFAVNADNTAWMKVGIITPLGGLCFITGWVLLIFSLCRQKKVDPIS